MSFMITICMVPFDHLDFPHGSDSKASVYNAGDLGSVPGLGKSPGEGIQNSALENPTRLSDFHFTT